MHDLVSFIMSSTHLADGRQKWNLYYYFFYQYGLISRVGSTAPLHNPQSSESGAKS